VRRDLLVVSIVLGLHLGVLWWLDRVPGPRPIWGDEIMYWEVASHWAAGTPAVLEPLWPPLYPRLLALAIQAGASRVWIQAAQVLLLVAALGLLADLLRRLVGGPVTVATVLLVALDSQVVAFAFYFWPEVLHLFLATATVWLAVTRAPAVAWPVLLGVTVGLTLLTKNLLGPLVPVAAAAWLLVAGRAAIGPLLVAGVAMTATLSPVAVAQYRQHGIVMPGDSALFNVWVGLHDLSPRNLTHEIVGDELAGFLASAPRQADRNRLLWARLRAFVADRGAAAILGAQIARQYRRLLDTNSFFTDQLPGSDIAGPDFGYRAPTPAQAWAARAVSWTVFVAILMLAPTGLLVLWRQHRAVAATVAIYLAYSFALYLVVHVKTRYRVAMMPALSLCAGAALVMASTGPRRAQALAGASWWWWRTAAGVGGLLAALALANTFAG
jgi:hypothetical protein